MCGEAVSSLWLPRGSPARSRGRGESSERGKGSPIWPHLQRTWTEQPFSKPTLSSPFRIVPGTQAKALNVKTSPKGNEGFLQARTAAPGPHSPKSKGGRDRLV